MLPDSVPFPTNLTIENSEDTLNLDLLEDRFGQYLIYQHPTGIVNIFFNLPLSRPISKMTLTNIINNVSTKE